MLAAKTAAGMISVERWAAFFWYITESEKRELVNEILEYEEGIEMASEVLLTVSRDEIERATLEHELKNTLDLQSKMTEAKEEGLALGLEQGQKQYARNMKVHGRPLNQIIEDTGLTVDQIEQL
ncbi:hypothetical protein FACS189476_11690 [Spirochaetia bacterium]|nr:hypothetical protein FACS189476_11690 [Spirochaetia bacterium]